MVQVKERKFGDIPDWAKRGPITAANYPFRAEAHCADRSAKRSHAHPTVNRTSAEFPLWREYFERHLGYRPTQLVVLLTEEPGKREMTVPELEPQWFDPSFEPHDKWFEQEYVLMGSRPRAKPPIPEGEDYYSMVAKHGIPVDSESPKKLTALLGPAETAADIIARTGITQEQWDAIPDGPKTSWRISQEAYGK